MAPLQTALARAIDRHTAGLSDTETAIAGLTLFRREAVMPPALCLIEPSLVMVAQGAKRLVMAGQGYGYDSERFLVTSLDLPANSEVVEASRARPCLGLGLKLDLRIVAELIAQGRLMPSRQPSADSSVGVGRLDAALLEPLHRLVRLLDDPAALPVLAPLVLREIHYRLLSGGQAPLLWHIVSAGSQSQRIAQAIDWLKLHYAEPLRIEDLADRAQMSNSTLHHHFKRLTAMSPLQYQKWLRLSEARRLMLENGADAASAAFQVGYESPSQFSREYARQFGAPPRREIEAVRSWVPGELAAPPLASR